MPVAEVDVVELEDRDRLGIASWRWCSSSSSWSSTTTRERSLRMKCELADDHEPADDGGGDHDDEHGGPGAEGLVEQPAESTAPPVAPMKKR